jgi:hypothetical protein
MTVPAQTDEQRLASGVKLATLLQTRKTVDLERKAQAARFKARLEQLDSDIAYHAAVVRNEPPPADSPQAVLALAELRAKNDY